jgi:hypothetical protein
VLSNVETGGGTPLVNIYWSAPANGIASRQSNKFDPLTYDYTINVAPATSSISITPTALSNKITSRKVNDIAVKRRSSTTVAVSAGGKITIDIVSPDGNSTTTYTFTVAKV